MATAKINGANYSLQPNMSGSGAKNSGGVTARAGNSSNLINVQVSRFNTTVFASTVLDNSWSDKAVSDGSFAYNNESPVAKRLTTILSGISNTVLRSGATQPGLIRSIHKLETLRSNRVTTGIRANKFNRYTGAWDNGFPVVAVDSLSTDTAATPTRAVPGQLTYKLGNPIPVTNNDYKAKTGG
jgi:hypothetical protein